MKISITYLGISVLERDLEPGSYTLGRSPDNDIQLTQEFVSRNHGRIFSEGEEWFYEDRAKDRTPLAETSRIALGPGLQLLVKERLWEEQTGVGDLNTLPKLVEELGESKRTITWLSWALAVVVALALAFGGYVLQRLPRSTHSILALVRPKIVELQLYRDPRMIEDLKQYARLTDADIREQVGFCSGFLVATNVVMTAFHCLDGQNRAERLRHFELRTYNDERLEIQRILGFDVKRDYMLLEVKGAEALGYLELETDPTVGERVYTIGNVEGEGIAIREGIAASLTHDPNDPTIQYLRYSAAASPGNSGGPLVDNAGRVLGLVFAKSSAENYNIATVARALSQGLDHYVHNKEPKEVSFDLTSLPEMTLPGLLTEFGFPWLTLWDDFPEDVRPFESVKVSLNVPQSIEAFNLQYTQELSRRLDETYTQIVARSKAAGRGEGRWTGIVGAGLDIAYLPDFFDATEYLYLKGKLIPKEARVSLPPSQRFVYDYLRALKDGDYLPFEGETFTALLQEPFHALNLGFRSGGDVKKSASHLFDVFDLLAFQNFSAGVGSLATWDKDLVRMLKDILLGREGLLFNTDHIPFVRPKSQRQFTVTELKGDPEVIRVTDSLGRSWQVFRWHLLSQSLLVYCLPTLMGQSCLSTLSPLENPESLAEVTQRMAMYVLSEVYVHQPYVPLRHLLDHRGKSLRDTHVYQDVAIDMGSRGDVTLRLKTLGLRVRIPAKLRASQLRVLGGLETDPKTQSSRFIALGVDVLAKDGSEPMGCSLAVEMQSPHGRHPAFRAYERQAQRLKKEGAPSAVRFTWHDFDALGSRGRVWTFCTPLQVRPDDGHVTWQVQKKRVFPVDYDVLRK